MHRFVEDLVKGSSTTPTFDDGAVCQEILDAVEDSAHRGSWSRIPLD
jgi:hypothetical protein